MCIWTNKLTDRLTFEIRDRQSYKTEDTYTHNKCKLLVVYFIVVANIVNNACYDHCKQFIQFN